MSDFATMLPGFAALAVSLTGLQVFQRNSPPKVIDPKLKGKLDFRVIACRPVSTFDEIRYVFDTVLGTYTMVSSGLRKLTIQVTFEGFDHGYGRDALFYLERLASRIVWPSSLAALNVLEMSLLDRGTFVDLSKVLSAEDRQWSVGTKDFIFLAVLNETPDNPDDNPANWIETVIFTSNPLLGEDGTPESPPVSGTVTFV